MRCYPEYKNSQLGWVGEIPKHWRVIKLRYLSQESKRKNDDDIVREMLSLSSYTGVQVKQYEYENTKRSKEESLAYLVVEPNQLVVNPMWQIQRGIGVSYLHGIVSPGYRVYYIDLERLIPQYLHYLMRSDIYVDEYNKHIRGLTTYDRSVKKEDFENIGVVLPSLSEQAQIANFLDRKTEQIDELIGIKERRIELLQEQRTALINQAVTKGLDPNVEMKPSEVEWIGEIPKHWRVKRNKRIFHERDDRSATGKEELLTVSHITGVSPRAEKKNVGMFLAETLEGYKHCSVGNLVINTMWAWMGALGISTIEGIVSPSYNVYELKSSEYLPRYYDYLYRTPNHVTEIIRWSKGIWNSRWRLYPDAFFSMFTITPPFREQAKIVDFLDCKTEQIDELMVAEQQKIELLKEYRQSLISEAVTGKIDVRNEV